jgi:hypothetical protein
VSPKDSHTHCGDGRRFVARADEKLTAFLELEPAIGVAERLEDRGGHEMMLDILSPIKYKPPRFTSPIRARFSNKGFGYCLCGVATGRRRQGYQFFKAKSCPKRILV